jgi:bifunctional UDP-N-acetylglucosamine pyrophosphorylase/glucosamine-1-phosphate N-acetyltransferase
VIEGRLWCGEGTTILPGVFVEGTVIIGRHSKIGPNCYLRGPLFIGDNCRVGQAVELKSVLVMNRTAIGHLSYVGDSVIADRVNFGAGTITANLRHDGAQMRSVIGGELVATGRRKLGAMVGEGVHTGIHTAIYPGRKLAAGSSTLPGEVVNRDKESS